MYDIKENIVYTNETKVEIEDIIEEWYGEYSSLVSINYCGGPSGLLNIIGKKKLFYNKKT